jgi:small Trp-rich protein
VNKRKGASQRDIIPHWDNVGTIPKVDARIDRYSLSQYPEATEVVMPLILLIVGLSLLKYFEVRFVANLSWWWIVGLGAVAFIWFEFLERMLGFDKRKAFEEMDKAREARVKKMFKK